MNKKIVRLPDGDFVTEDYLLENSQLEIAVQNSKKVIVHTFIMGDVEDPDLFAAEPLLKWENSQAGSWVMKHAIRTPVWHRIIDQHHMGYRYTITAELSAKDYTFWVLKWGSKNEL